MMVIANLTYTARTEATVRSKIIISTNHTEKNQRRIEVPYTARVIHGNFSYSPDDLMFPLHKMYPQHLNKSASNLATDFHMGNIMPEPVIRELWLVNRFSVPVHLKEMTLDHPNFRMSDLVVDTVIQPKARFLACQLHFTPNSTSLNFVTELILSTNASSFHLPIHVFSGKLQLISKPSFVTTQFHHNYVPVISSSSNTNSVTLNEGVAHGENGLLDFGTVAVTEHRFHSFILRNDNPMPITLFNVTCSLPTIKTRLMMPRSTDSVATSKAGLTTDERERVVSTIHPTQENEMSEALEGVEKGDGSDVSPEGAEILDHGPTLEDEKKRHLWTRSVRSRS